MDWKIPNEPTPSPDDRRLSPRRCSWTQQRWQGPAPTHGRQALNRRDAGCRTAPNQLFEISAAHACTSRAAYCPVCHAFTSDPKHPEPAMPSVFPGRPAMSIADRAFLRDPRNRHLVKRLWARIDATPITIAGVALAGLHDLLDETALLDEDEIPDFIVGHWRHVDYRVDGSRVALIPGGFVARDLNALGLSREAVLSDTVEFAPIRCPACRRSESPSCEPVRQQRPPAKPADHTQGAAKPAAYSRQFNFKIEWET